MTRDGSQAFTGPREPLLPPGLCQMTRPLEEALQTLRQGGPRPLPQADPSLRQCLTQRSQSHCLVSQTPHSITGAWSKEGARRVGGCRGVEMPSCYLPAFPRMVPGSLPTQSLIPDVKGHFPKAREQRKTANWASRARTTATPELCTYLVLAVCTPC